MGILIAALYIFVPELEETKVVYLGKRAESRLVFWERLQLPLHLSHRGSLRATGSRRLFRAHVASAVGRVTVQSVSLALPVRRSHSCQTRPRWLRR